MIFPFLLIPAVLERQLRFDGLESTLIGAGRIETFCCFSPGEPELRERFESLFPEYGMLISCLVRFSNR